MSLRTFSLVAGAKGRRRARVSVYPESRQQQHRANGESQCRAEEAAMLWITENHREREAPDLNTSWAQRNFIESPQETSSSVSVHLCAQEAPQQAAALLYTKKCTNPLWISHSYTLSHRRTSFCLLCELLLRRLHFKFAKFGQNTFFKIRIRIVGQVVTITTNSRSMCVISGIKSDEEFLGSF